MEAKFRPGDVVVYEKQKVSVRPGTHAKNIHAAEHGETYSYSVDKYWRVVSVGPDDTLVVRTRTGKQNTIAMNDPNLRPIRWWDWGFNWRRFPA